MVGGRRRGVVRLVAVLVVLGGGGSSSGGRVRVCGCGRHVCGGRCGGGVVSGRRLVSVVGVSGGSVVVVRG